jgi:hypothetical protein
MALKNLRPGPVNAEPIDPERLRKEVVRLRVGALVDNYHRLHGLPSGTDEFPRGSNRKEQQVSCLKAGAAEAEPPAVTPPTPRRRRTKEAGRVLPHGRPG